MLTEVDIANDALIRLGDKTIATLADNTKQCQVIRARIDRSRQSVLRMHPWKFACDRKLLYPLSIPEPVFDYTYTYDLPSNCLRILRVNDNDVQYIIEQGKILSNEATLEVRFIRDILFGSPTPIVDYTVCDPLFIDCMSAYLAWSCCYAILQSNEMKDQLWKDFLGIRAQARFVDATEQLPETLRAEEYLLARIGGTNGGFVRDPGT